uniref:peptidylprolyl isomerase n=1 Tax=Coccolithus braarudii TaxID=221442 RepID=A0A7S0LFP7_9EUKA|mmetsp:Transcript_36195/g.77193  ORF Transcript_36195/g.77193 Transcript_36195/m.77193 type:complete len:183 (+) Transcript_36195:19-567(+)
MAPTVLDKVVEAVTAIADASGASRAAIAKSIKEAHGVVGAHLLKRALTAGVQKGMLEQRSAQRFALAGVTLAPREDETVRKTVVKVGAGSEVAKAGDTVEVKYVGSLEANGERFDAANKFVFTLGAGEVIKGWDQGVVGMGLGERATLVVPSKLGYGKRGALPEIPPNATLVFDITLKRICT